MLVRILCGVKHYGMENLPKKGSYMVACNHVSHLDAIAAGAFIKGNMNYMGKKELFEGRFWGWYMPKLNLINIDRDAPARGMREVIARIKKGQPIFIFPEGTRGDGSSFLEPEPGAAYLAIKHNLPVVPVYVKGTNIAFPKGARGITRHTVRVYYGESKVYHMPAGVSKNEGYKEVSRQIMNEIKLLKEKYDA
ncbi:MAG: 1-acyl-sn-glycerol-3-phosphate acyltransferase [Candidatus Omnitrophica bacterium]|nr:1-acyl-sn-glycerol-3-phosphate acyltransferase [Candidatus Omnitrophota bacterium]MCG2705347.1 1-acyl-sn-glycerol-3-phosphate acyltransferase [Candidatus Omnitrophota bacterium]